MENLTAHDHPKASPYIDYLVVGHITADLTNSGVRIGGTAAYSGLTAKALGLRSGIYTSFAEDLDPLPISSLWIHNIAANHSTTFKNVSNGVDRTQYLYQVAAQLTMDEVPIFFPPPAIIHLGPVANEVDPKILTVFPDSLKCLTPQGWFRITNDNNEVEQQIREDWEHFFIQSDVVVISQDDVQKDEDCIARMASVAPVFVVTENYKGARVYWNNDARYINAPKVIYNNDTGAGDIFAAAFFYRYFYTRDPWEAGRFAVLLASWSVNRAYLHSIPTPDEILKAKTELLGT
jgi:sugar/nucleoside kinase (ribokinase family)